MTSLKSKLIGLGTGIALIGISLESEAQINGNIEYITSEIPSNSYMRLNGFYGLPSDIKAFSFLEFYKENKGYFGKTTLTKPITKNLSAKTQIAHVNEPFTKEGFGLSANVSSKNKKASLSVDYYPVWISKDLKKTKNESVVGYFASLKLPHNISVSSFGQINIGAKDGPTWNYGEASIEKSFGKDNKWTAGYNPALQRKTIGKVMPKVEHRFTIKRKF